jgi:hypothetical protein
VAEKFRLGFRASEAVKCARKRALAG